MWKLNYVDRLSVFTDNIHTLFGTSMHEVLQEYLRVMYTKSIKEADQLYLDEMLEDRLKINFLEIVKFNSLNLSTNVSTIALGGINEKNIVDYLGPFVFEF